MRKINERKKFTNFRLGGHMPVGHHVRILRAEHNGEFRWQQSPVSPAARSRDKLHDMG